MYQALRTWPKCRIHWLVQYPIDSPAMWLSDATWKSIRLRFTSGSTIPIAWPRPHFASICTSPEFIPEPLKNDLLKVVENHREKYILGKSAEQVHKPDVIRRNHKMEYRIVRYYHVGAEERLKQF